jgi:hypothetical protein
MDSSISIHWWVIVTIATAVIVTYLHKIKIDAVEKRYYKKRTFPLTLLFPLFMFFVGIIVAWINNVEIVDYLLLQNTENIRLILIVNLVVAYALFASVLILRLFRGFK